jgi:hypothetical protein
MPNCPKHHSSGRRELSVQTFLCVKKLWTVLACIRPNLSAARPNDTQCSSSYRISFQNTDMGRSLQPSRHVDSRPDALIHKASCALKIQTSGRQPSWSGRVSYLYGNCVQLKCDRPNNRATPFGHGSKQERISGKFWEADCIVVLPDVLCLPSGRCLGLSSQTLIWTCSL